MLKEANCINFVQIQFGLGTLLIYACSPEHQGANMSYKYDRLDGALGAKKGGLGSEATIHSEIIGKTLQPPHIVQNTFKTKFAVVCRARTQCQHEFYCTTQPYIFRGTR